MPKKPSKDKEKRTFRFSEEQLKLCCEWGECKETFDSMRSFIFHVVLHCQACCVDEKKMCHWRGCGYLAETYEQFKVHVNFHSFHAKIKSIGANHINRMNLEQCNRTDGTNLIPELPSKLVCEWENCKLSFDNPELFYRHCEEHVVGTVCQWEGCKWSFKEVHRLREHLRTHSQEKMIACPNCGSLFSNRTKFHDHLRRQTPTEEQKYRCSHCSKILASERFLRDHMRSHINNYKCLFCDMTCSTPSSLRNHIIYRHTNQRLFTCKGCNYSGKSQSDLQKHLKTHTRQTTFNCEYEGCGFIANCTRKLKMHSSLKHGEPKNESSKVMYNCHLCDTKVNRGSYLTRHLISKHNFQWPSGHSRFRYKRNDDGSYQLQTIRYESIELTQEMIDRDEDNDDLVVDEGDLDDVDSPPSVAATVENRKDDSRCVDRAKQCDRSIKTVEINASK